MTGEGKRTEEEEEEEEETERKTEGREMGEESKRKTNILPEWFSNRAHAQHNVEIVSYSLN